MMSSICSIPTDTRTTSGPAPASTSSASDNWLWVVEAGGLYWNPAQQRYETTSSEPAETFAARPHLVGLTRDLESVRPGSWMRTGSAG